MEAPWTLAPCRWNDGDHAMMHKMEIKCKKDHIISHFYACDVNPFYASYFCLDMIATVAL
jgi:hypothetical protein